LASYSSVFGSALRLARWSVVFVTARAGISDVTLSETFLAFLDSAFFGFFSVIAIPPPHGVLDTCLTNQNLKDCKKCKKRKFLKKEALK